MTRTPRVCLVLVVVVLLALLTAPLAGARTVSSSPAHPVVGGWLSAALHWAADLAGLQPQGHRPPPVHQKDGTVQSGVMQPNGGSCVNPDGRPNPLCGGV